MSDKTTVEDGILPQNTHILTLAWNLSFSISILICLALTRSLHT
ncbi:hypothetical protein [Salibacterium salarium]|nr:hypothetical protein [Salibacterium salarium]